MYNARRACDLNAVWRQQQSGGVESDLESDRILPKFPSESAKISLASAIGCGAGEWISAEIWL